MQCQLITKFVCPVNSVFRQVLTKIHKNNGNVVSNLGFYNPIKVWKLTLASLSLFLQNTLSKLDKILERVYAVLIFIYLFWQLRNFPSLKTR